MELSFQSKDCSSTLPPVMASNSVTTLARTACRKESLFRYRSSAATRTTSTEPVITSRLPRRRFLPGGAATRVLMDAFLLGHSAQPPNSFFQCVPGLAEFPAIAPAFHRCSAPPECSRSCPIPRSAAAPPLPGHALAAEICRDSKLQQHCDLPAPG